MKVIFLTLLIFFLLTEVRAQTVMDFEKYDPPSTLVVPEHKITRSKFPFIDVHSHQHDMPTQNLNELTEAMDKLNMAVMVNLSGEGGERLKLSIANIKANAPKRFIVFTNINFSGIGENDWASIAVKKLEEDVKNGASGLKIFKNLGFSAKDINGSRVQVDDPREQKF